MLDEVYKHIQLMHTSRGSFVANVLTLITGTTIAQGILIAISPILTRIYKPEDFGIFAIYLAVVSMIAIIATGRYELAIMLPENDDDAINIIALSVGIAFLISLITLIIIWLFNTQITKTMGRDELSKWLYLIPVSILLTGIYQAFNYWSNRKKQYKRLAISRITQSTSTASVNLGMGFAGFGFSGLILGGLVGQGIATYVLGWQIWREYKEKRKLISIKKIKENMEKYKDFPRINSIHAFTDLLQSSGVVFLISTFFGTVILGFYYFTWKILNAPLGLIGSSVSQVFIQKATETYNNGGDLQLLVKKTMIRLSLIAFPIFIILVFFAPDIFALIFGNNWREAGVYAQILSPWILLNFLVSPVSQIPIIVNKQKTNFFISLIGNLLIFLSILYGVYIADIKAGFYLLSFCLTIQTSYIMVWIYKVAIIK